MKIIESRLQSKASATPDHGGDDKIFISDDFIAVIDGVTAKHDTVYPYKGASYPSGTLAGHLLSDAMATLSASMTCEEITQVLDQAIHDTYIRFGILDDVTINPAKRIAASLVLYHRHNRQLLIGGDCHALLGTTYYHYDMIVDALNSDARATEINRLIVSGELTEAQLNTLPAEQDPGRQLLLSPPLNSNFPGLNGQSVYQNNSDHPYGFFVFDGFANPRARGYDIVTTADTVHDIVLASDGYIIPADSTPHETLDTLVHAEDALARILRDDPSCYRLYKAVKGKGTNHSFDDRSYIRFSV